MNELPKEVTDLIEQINAAEIITGMFLTFDNLMMGFGINDNYEYCMDDDSGVVAPVIVSKVASVFGGVFHLVKFKNDDDVYFTIGINDSTATGHTFALTALDAYSDEIETLYDDTYLTLSWQNHVVPCLNDLEKLRETLTHVADRLQMDQDFLMYFADDHYFQGLVEHTLGVTFKEDEFLSEESFEAHFRAFIQRVNSDILPKLKF